jgi:hypothetical protein
MLYNCRQEDDRKLAEWLKSRGGGGCIYLVTSSLNLGSHPEKAVSA